MPTATTTLDAEIQIHLLENREKLLCKNHPNIKRITSRIKPDWTFYTKQGSFRSKQGKPQPEMTVHFVGLSKLAVEKMIGSKMYDDCFISQYNSSSMS